MFTGLEMQTYKVLKTARHLMAILCIKANFYFLSLYSMACLVQLSSLNGYVFAKKEDRLNYLSNYLQHLLQLLQGLGQSGAIQAWVYKKLRKLSC